MLLPFVSEAQNFVIPTVSDLATARRNVTKGNSSNYVLAMYRDTLRLVGATALFNVGYSDASSIALRQFNITGGTGVSVSGGSGNLTADRSVSISIPQAISTTSSPSFVGINASGNITAGGNLTVTGTSNFNGNIIYSSSKYQQVQSYASSNNYQTFKWFIDGTGDASSLALETTRRSGSSISVRYPFLVHNGKVRINGLDTSLPTKDFEVLGDVAMQGTVYFPLSYQYPVNTFLKVGTNGELQGYDLNAILNAKLDTTGAMFNHTMIFNDGIDLSKSYSNGIGTHSIRKDGNILSFNHFFTPNNGMIAPTDNFNVLTLVNNNVGINTDAPNTNLHVAGGVKINNNLELNDIPDVRAAINAKLAKSSNLSDLSNVVTARTNLGLGTLATLSTVSLTSNVTGILPIANGGTGLSSLASGIQTFLSTPSSANLLAALTTKTGTGNAVFDTNPTISGLTASTITGGSGTTSTLTFKTTSGVGATGANMFFQVGNNGATPGMTILNNGNVGVGTTNPSTLFHAATTSQQNVITLESSNTTPVLAGTVKLGQNNRTGLNYRGEFQLILNSFNGTSYFDNEVLTAKHDGKIGVGTTSPNSLLENAGSQGWKFTTISGATTLGEHYMVLASGGSTYAVTLPTASTVPGRTYIIKTATANKTISSFLNTAGSSSTTLTAGTVVVLASDGTNWQQMN